MSKAEQIPRLFDGMRVGPTHDDPGAILDRRTRQTYEQIGRRFNVTPKIDHVVQTAVLARVQTDQELLLQMVKLAGLDETSIPDAQFERTYDAELGLHIVKAQNGKVVFAVGIADTSISEPLFAFGRPTESDFEIRTRHCVSDTLTQFVRDSIVAPATEFNNSNFELNLLRRRFEPVFSKAE